MGFRPGYVLFDSELLAAAEIVSATETGKTPDEAVNEWHRDLVDLSGNKLVTLTRAILENGELGTILKKRLRELVEAEYPRKAAARKTAFQARLESFVLPVQPRVFPDERFRYFHA